MMFLTEANVLHYLEARKFAVLESVAGGTYAVRNLSRRNRNFRVTCGRREYLIKQAGKWDFSGRSTVEQEAAFYRQARTDPRFEPLRLITPESHSYDPENSILIFEFLPDDIPLADSPARLSQDTARLAGSIMARIHAEMRLEKLAQASPMFPPAYFSMTHWGPGDLSDASEGQRQLVRLVQRHREFAPALDSLEAEWQARTLIHGDWKVENCLVGSSGDSMHVIDWELAGWGDPRWDLATLLESWWCLCLREPEENSLEELQPVLRALLDSYAEASRAEKPPLRRQSVAFAAVRMLQSAWESVQKAEGIEPLAVMLVQASLNLLTRPEWGAAQLLGSDD